MVKIDNTLFIHSTSSLLQEELVMSKEFLRIREEKKVYQESFIVKYIDNNDEVSWVVFGQNSKDFGFL